MDVDPEEVDFSWYSGGRLNACYNCVDRHLEERGEQTAIIWAGDEPGDYRYISYREVKHNVARIANVLRAHGVKKGDRVCIYLPMTPELAYAMLACARIGAVHSVVFAGFSAESLRDRILDAGCKVVFTANEGMRGGRRIPLKATVDQAVEGLPVVEKVFVVRRTDKEVPMRAGRDLWLEEETARQRSTCPIEWMAAEDPLFILYTSGSTGKPKGVLHTTAGYLVYAAMTHKYVFDYHPGDIYCCAADIGWVTGHSYILYGPLANGATTVMFESIPTYPDPGRYWRMVDDLGINIFYTAPTAIRAIARSGDEWVTKYRRDLAAHPGLGRRADQPGGLALVPRRGGRGAVRGGRHLVADGDRRHPDHAAAGRHPVQAGLGDAPVLRRPAGDRRRAGAGAPGNDVSGNLCLRGTWPGQARTIYGDHSGSARPTSRSSPASTSPATAAGATRTATTGSPAASTTC